MEDRTGDHQPLGHPAREREHRRPAPLAEMELLEQLVGDAARVFGGYAEQPAVEVKVLPHRQLPVERVRLRYHPDQLLGQRRMGDHVDRPDEGASRGRDHARRQHSRGGRLARAVGPEESEDLACRDGQIELVDGREVAARVDLRQVDGADDPRRGAVVVGASRADPFRSCSWRRTPMIADRPCSDVPDARFARATEESPSVRRDDPGFVRLRSFGQRGEARPLGFSQPKLPGVSPGRQQWCR